MATGFGIIGCGMIANFHCKALAEIQDAKFVACYDRDFERAQKLAAEFGGVACAELDEMLGRSDISVVTICTPSGLHMEPCVEAAKAGKHVIVEKPLDVTVDRCDAMIEACGKAGVKLAVVFPSRFHRSSKLMKKAVDAGRFGTLSLGDAYVKWFRTQAYYDSGAWRGTWKFDGGGALMNQAVHSVDLLLWLMGPAVEVMAHSALLAHTNIEVEDTVTATVRFANGALGVIEATTASFPGTLKKIEITGSHGTAILEEEDIIKWDFAEALPEDEKLRTEMASRISTGGGASDPSAIGHHAHAELFRDLLAALKEGREPEVNGVQGRRSVQLILAIYESARTGQKVTIAN